MGRRLEAPPARQRASFAPCSWPIALPVRQPGAVLDRVNAVWLEGAVSTSEGVRLGARPVRDAVHGIAEALSRTARTPREP